MNSCLTVFYAEGREIKQGNVATSKPTAGSAQDFEEIDPMAVSNSESSSLLAIYEYCNLVCVLLSQICVMGVSLEMGCSVHPYLPLKTPSQVTLPDF